MKNIKNNEIKILIVDDEEKILPRLYRIITKEGYIADTASDGIVAIEKIAANNYDIVLTDINMPNKNGFEIIEYIKNSNIDTLPLVFTGYASVDSAIRAIQLGAYDFIQKPIDAETLKIIISRAVERVVLKRENAVQLLELKKLNELKDEFISVVSHDLRSPLSTIGGYANYLIKKGNLTQIQQSYIQIIKDMAADLYSLVNELLDVSKIEAGAMRLNKKETDLAYLINISINNFVLLALDKNIDIVFVNELKNQIVSIDPMKISQVMNNLINNAIKFTEKGKITVSARDDEENSLVEIMIQDSGIGIPKESLEQIFDKFSYSHKKGTRGEPGTGLGLTICKRFIELHSGSIRAYSEENQGSTFTISIPRG